MDNQTPPNADNKDDTTLTEVLKRFKTSRNYTEGGFWATWENCWKLYNNERVAIGYDGYADTFIPETYTEVQAIKAHLTNGNLEIEFMPTHPDQKGDVSLLQDLFNYAWYKDYMDLKLDSTLTEYIVTGNCYIWSYAGESGLPCQTVVSAKDCFFDTQSKNYEDLCEYGYGGYRYLTHKDDLENAKIPNSQYDNQKDDSEKNSKIIKRYKNLDRVGQYSDNGDDKTAKQEREEMLVGAVSEDEDLVECIVYYDKDKMVTIANRTVVIEEVDTPFQRKKKTVQSVDDQGNQVSFEMPEIKSFIPVAPFRNLVDANLWYARGDVEVIADSQERLNDVQAQKTDNLTYQLNRMWALDPNFAQKLNEIQSVPGAVFTIPPGALEQIQTQPIGADADNEIARIKQEMQGASGANESFETTTQTSGRQSAYQINQNLVALGARFQGKIKNLQNEGMRILAQNMWKIMQIYINKEIPIRVGGIASQTWGTYNPGLYLGDWDVQVKLGATADSIKETERQQAMQFYLLASKQPFINQQALYVEAATKIFDMSKREAISLIAPPPPPQQAPTIAASLANDLDRILPELYPDEQSEVLQDLGITPSPLRQEQTGINASAPNPDVIAANQAAVNASNGGGGGTPQQAFEQAGMQTAGSPPVGAPTSGVANMPKVPS